MNCPYNDFDDCAEYKILIEQHDALARLLDAAQQAQRDFMAHVISDHIQAVIERRAAHFFEHYRAHKAKR